MPSKIYTLGLMLLLAGSALAQNKTYTVQQGDTISEIANMFNVRRADLIAANALSKPDNLKLGQVLRIPFAPTVVLAETANTPKASAPKPVAVSHSSYKTYVVRNGDHDWSLSRRFGISMQELHDANPSVDWSKLQIGTTIRVPGEVAEKPSVVLASAEPKKSKAEITKTTGYKVRSGDNDWIIAHRHGISITKLKAANPNVNFSNLQIGAVLRVPTSKAASAATMAVASNPARIRTRYARVAGDGSIIRRSPSTTGSKVATVAAGTQVTILDHESGWYKLKFPKGTVGWMRGDLLKPLSASTLVASNAGSKKSTKSSSKKRKTSSSLVASRQPSSSGAPANASDLIKKAYTFKGIRYRWGGTSRSGFDCSGFVTAVFRGKGVSLPRTSIAMSGTGSKVDKSDLRAGDLVFFRTRTSSRINHVGIYVGGGKFIHSSSGQGGVREDSLNSGYYQRKYATGRRVLK